MYPQLTLDVVVNSTGKRHHFLLTWLHTQRHPTARCRSWCRSDNVIRKRSDFWVQHHFTVPQVYQLTISIWEELFQIHEEYCVLTPVSPIMPCKLFFEPMKLPMQSRLI